MLQLVAAIDELQPNVKNPLRASFVFWNKDQSSVPKRKRLDPNYLTQGEWAHSAFHRSLHLFMQKNQGKPLLHFDLHGSLDRYYTADVEIGVDSVESLWPYQDQAAISNPFVKALKSSMNKVFQDIKIIKG